MDEATAPTCSTTATATTTTRVRIGVSICACARTRICARARATSIGFGVINLCTNALNLSGGCFERQLDTQRMGWRHIAQLEL